MNSVHVYTCLNVYIYTCKYTYVYIYIYVTYTYTYHKICLDIHSYVLGVSRPKHLEARPVPTQNYTHDAYMRLYIHGRNNICAMSICVKTNMSTSSTFELFRHIISLKSTRALQRNQSAPPAYQISQQQSGL